MARKPKQTGNLDDPRRSLASVAALLETPAIQALVAESSHPVVLDAIHEALAWFREHLQAGDRAPEVADIVAKVEEVLARGEMDRLRPVVNATGIILHTGLGRAVLPQRAVDALAALNRCCNLQMDLETGLRGKRNAMIERLLCRLTGAEAATVVTNNAGATFLILSALSKGREVLISRGQLIEIGGSFRLPDCIHQSGAIMVEVGTTNKTHLRDYEQALNENTSMLLHVNPSNYRIIGFSEDVPIADLVALKKTRPVLVVDDLGCGALVNLEQYGLPKEPTVQESIAAGVDLACFSGDKLIGGPQAGIIVGKREWIDKIKKHPLSRMLRVGKLTAMALEHTLRLFLHPESLLEHHPTLRMLTLSADTLRKTVDELKQRLDKENLALDIQVEEGESATGGGSLPGVSIKTFVLSVSWPKHSADELSRLLRKNEPPIISRIQDDKVLLDMRTLLAGEAECLFEALAGVGR
jgi:L-seryl-tRNA(Ser) seleniumtransferase